jgi:hypothetical protein
MQQHEPKVHAQKRIMPSNSFSQFSLNWVYLGAGVVVGAVWIWLNWYATGRIGPWANLAADLFAAVVVVLLTNIFLGGRLEREQRRQIGGIIAEIEGLKGTFFKDMAPDQQLNIIIQFFRDACPGATDEQIDEHVKYLGNQKGRRREFEYSVRFRPLSQTAVIRWGSASQPAPPVQLFADQYWINETDVSFLSRIEREWESSKLYAAVCFNSDQLARAFRDPQCVYREQLMLNGDQLPIFEEAIKSLGKDARGALESITKVARQTRLFEAELALNGRRWPVNMRYDPAVGICYDFWLDQKHFESEELRLQWTMRLPFGKSRSCYPVLFSLPTHVRRIRLDASVATSNLQLHQALTVMDKDAIHLTKDLGQCEINLEDQWVMPTSGVFFWWPSSPGPDA